MACRWEGQPFHKWLQLKWWAYFGCYGNIPQFSVLFSYLTLKSRLDRAHQSPPIKNVNNKWGQGYAEEVAGSSHVRGRRSVEAELLYYSSTLPGLTQGEAGNLGGRGYSWPLFLPKISKMKFSMLTHVFDQICSHFTDVNHVNRWLTSPISALLTHARRNWCTLSDTFMQGGQPSCCIKFIDASWRCTFTWSASAAPFVLCSISPPRRASRSFLMPVWRNQNKQSVARKLCLYSDRADRLECNLARVIFIGHLLTRWRDLCDRTWFIDWCAMNGNSRLSNLQRRCRLYLNSLAGKLATNIGFWSAQQKSKEGQTNIVIYQ